MGEQHGKSMSVWPTHSIRASFPSDGTLSLSKVQGSATSSHQRRSDHFESARSNSSKRFLFKQNQSHHCDHFISSQFIKNSKKRWSINKSNTGNWISMDSHEAFVHQAMAQHVPRRAAPLLVEAELQKIPWLPRPIRWSCLWWVMTHPTLWPAGEANQPESQWTLYFQMLWQALQR